jgi:serpin B
VTPTKKIAVAMMQTQAAPFKYFSDNDCQWLELPYNDLRASMILILPAKGRLTEVEKRLTASALQETVGKLKFHRGIVALPKFKVSAAARLDEDLKALGMELAFSSAADFSGMVGRRELSISKVIHQAYLSADELGSEAAAATAVVMFSSDFPPFSFTANRPFLFLIRDNQTGSVLFLGRIVHPAAVS